MVTTRQPKISTELGRILVLINSRYLVPFKLHRKLKLTLDLQEYQARVNAMRKAKARSAKKTTIASTSAAT